MSVKNHPCQNSFSQLHFHNFFFLLSLYLLSPVTLIISDVFFQKVQKIPKVYFLQFLFNFFRVQSLMVVPTLNFNSFGLKSSSVDSTSNSVSRFDSIRPVLWTINFDSCSDCKLGQLSTFLFPVSLSN